MCIGKATVFAQTPLPLGTMSGVLPEGSYMQNPVALATSAKIYFGTGSDPLAGAPYYATGKMWQFDVGTSTWSGIPNLPVPRANAFGFVINQKLYVGGGDGLGYLTHYTFNPSTNNWAALSDCPVRMGASSGVVGTKAYMSSATFPFNLYEYNSTTDGWSLKTAMPSALSGPLMVSNGGFVYAYSSAGTQSFQRYDPALNTWALMATPPAQAVGTALYSIGTQIYLRSGSTWEYDIAGNSWTQRSAPPATAPTATVTVFNGKAYLIASRPVGLSADIWEHNVGNDSWSRLKPLAGNTQRRYAVGMTINNKGYVGLGQGQFGSALDWWEYEPSTTAWLPRANFPGSIPTGIGLSIANKGYVLSGTQLWCYDPSTNTWLMKSSFPGTNATLGFAIGSKGYFGGPQLWEYDPSTDAWTSRATCPAAAPSFSWALNGKGYFGSATGADATLWEYDAVANTWTQRASYPGQPLFSPSSIASGHRGYVGIEYASGDPLPYRYWFYEQLTNTWGVAPYSAGGLYFQPGSTWFLQGGYFHIGTGGGGLYPLANIFTSFDATTYDCQGTADGSALPGSACNDNNLNTTNDTWSPNCVCTGTPIVVRLAVRALLEGAAVEGSAYMQDVLRSNGLVPITEPYSSLGYNFVNGGAESTTVPVLTSSSMNAIVDWVVVELRSSASPAVRVAARSALIQRDGDIVDVDGVSPVSINAPNNSYYVAVRHRNHLGVMTAIPIPLSYAPATIDFTSTGTATYGSQAQKTSFGVTLMWAGDVNFNGSMSYTGSNNDRDPILVAVGATTPNGSLIGYRKEDVNMDAVVRYTGTGNDRDLVLQNIGSTTPNAVRQQQLP